MDRELIVTINQLILRNSDNTIHEQLRYINTLNKLLNY